MKDEEVHEWSRHFDTLLWTVTGIIVAADGGLLLFAFERTDFHVGVAVLGIALTILGPYFGASFRTARAGLHSKLTEDDLALVRGSARLKQWPSFVLVFELLAIMWVLRLLDRFPERPAVIAVLGMAVAAWILAVGLVGRGRLGARKNA